MTVDKTSHQPIEQSKIKNPLADIAGKFGGEFWLETQSEIEHSRKMDKEQTKQIQDTDCQQD